MTKLRRRRRRRHRQRHYLFPAITISEKREYVYAYWQNDLKTNARIIIIIIIVLYRWHRPISFHCMHSCKLCTMQVSLTVSNALRKQTHSIFKFQPQNERATTLHHWKYPPCRAKTVAQLSIVRVICIVPQMHIVRVYVIALKLTRAYERARACLLAGVLSPSFISCLPQWKCFIFFLFRFDVC